MKPSQLESQRYWRALTPRFARMNARGLVMAGLTLWMLGACTSTPSLISRKKSELPPPPEDSNLDALPSDPSLIDPRANHDDARTCPTPFMDFDQSACLENEASYGLSPENPAEWGFGAGTRTLWFGRLMCQSGAMPDIVRVQSLEAPTLSSSPQSPSHARPETDVLDLWHVTCPEFERPLEIYHNMYRCGSPCSPTGTSLLPALAYEAYIESYKAHEKQDASSALAFATKAHELAPKFELTTLWLALMQHETGNYEQALPLYEAVLVFKPSDTFSRVQRAILFNALDRPADALTITTPLLESLSDADGSIYFDVLCAHASALLQTRPGDARTLAKRSCEAGVKACC